MRGLALAVLGSALSDEIMAYLDVEVGQETGVAYLDELVAAYARRVPWESVSRIAKKTKLQQETGAADGQACARWPVEFWQEAMSRGTGGTCFEGNYAFLALLQTLGYSGYLTVNNMEPTIGCHSAIVLTIDGRPWLVDVGLPLYAPLPLDPNAPTQRESRFHLYTVRPTKPNAYVIERSHHPQTYCFTLINRAVPEATYRQRLADDYGPNGFFLDRAIISKVVDGYVSRFNGGEKPYILERFWREYVEKSKIGDNPAAALAEVFSFDKQLIERSLQATDVAG